MQGTYEYVLSAVVCPALHWPVSRLPEVKSLINPVPRETRRPYVRLPGTGLAFVLIPDKAKYSTPFRSQSPLEVCIGSQRA